MGGRRFEAGPFLRTYTDFVNGFVEQLGDFVQREIEVDRTGSTKDDISYGLTVEKLFVANV
jgi:hypothetical protein